MDILEIAKSIKKAGGELYLVGGAIRDELLQLKIKDEDYCIVGLEENEFLSLFPEAKSRGKSFKVYDIDGKEFALARTEKKNGVGHKEFEIITNKKISIEQDLARRDITINAIAKKVLTGEIIDPFNGKKDIKDNIIRATTTQFKEDPLRVYRVARFAATFGFEVEENTIKWMNELKNELNTLSKERVFQEFRKALNSKNPSVFFYILKKADVMEVHFKEIEDLIGKIQPIQYHPEGDSYDHTMLALENSANLTKNEIWRFCALVHDLGKGTTKQEMLPHHYGHEKRGIEPLKKFCKALGVPKQWEKAGKTAVLEHMRGGIFEKMSPEKQISFLERVAKSTLGLEGLEIVVKSDRNRGEKQEDIHFASIGKRMLEEINGKVIQEKYSILPSKALEEKMHQERVKWRKKEICQKKLNQK